MAENPLFENPEVNKNPLFEQPEVNNTENWWCFRRSFGLYEKDKLNRVKELKKNYNCVNSKTMNSPTHSYRLIQVDKIYPTFSPKIVV